MLAANPKKLARIITDLQAETPDVSCAEGYKGSFFAKTHSSYKTKQDVDYLEGLAEQLPSNLEFVARSNNIFAYSPDAETLKNALADVSTKLQELIAQPQQPANSRS